MKFIHINKYNQENDGAESTFVEWMAHPLTVAFLQDFHQAQTEKIAALIDADLSELKASKAQGAIQFIQEIPFGLNNVMADILKEDEDDEPEDNSIFPE